MNTLAELAKTQSIRKLEGENFSALFPGKFANLSQYSFEHPLLKRKASGKLFLKDHLELTSMQISFNRLPAGVAVPFGHAHKHNEEVYIFIGGRGQMQIDEQIFDIEEGAVVRVAPSGVRTWRNNSDEDLYYIVIQAKDGSLAGDTFDDGIPSDKALNWDRNN